MRRSCLILAVLALLSTSPALGQYSAVIAACRWDSLHVCASAPPSGPVHGDAYETVCRMITDAVGKGGYDALWLDLHGAMATDRFEDGEGELLRRIRAIDPGTLAEPREVGRRQLPTTVAGLLTHIAEHTARHVGEAIITAKVIRTGA